MKKRRRLSPDEFVAHWRDSYTFRELLKRVHMKANSASVRASRYRRAGVKLKKFPPPGRGGLDVKRLNRKAKA